LNDMKSRIIARGAADQDFRARLLSDSRAAILEEFGIPIPGDFNVAVHEDTDTATHLVLPPTGQLSEVALQFASGGYGGDDPLWHKLIPVSVKGFASAETVPRWDGSSSSPGMPALARGYGKTRVVGGSINGEAQLGSIQGRRSFGDLSIGQISMPTCPI